MRHRRGRRRNALVQENAGIRSKNAASGGTRRVLRSDEAACKANAIRRHGHCDWQRAGCLYRQPPAESGACCIAALRERSELGKQDLFIDLYSLSGAILALGNAMSDGVDTRVESVPLLHFALPCVAGSALLY